MKYLLVVAVIYGIYRFTQVQKKLDAQRRAQLNKEEDDEGFTEYEEVD